MSPLSSEKSKSNGLRQLAQAGFCIRSNAKYASQPGVCALAEQAAAAFDRSPGEHTCCVVTIGTVTPGAQPV